MLGADDGSEYLVDSKVLKEVKVSFTGLGPKTEFMKKVKHSVMALIYAIRRFQQTVWDELRRFASNPYTASKVAIALLLLTLLFISVKVNSERYVVLVAFITLMLWSYFSVGKNIGLYLYYTLILIISEIGLYVQNGRFLPFWLATVMLLVVGGFLLFLGVRLYRLKASGSFSDDVVFENLFAEREQDLARLTRYLKKFKVLGINSFWGNGKTCLYEMFKMRNEESYYFISISIMTLQLDSVEKFLVSEIAKVLEQNKIYSAASEKLAMFLNGDFFHGLGRIFVRNSSYTESFQTLMSDIDKLDRPLFITFEDIDRTSDRSVAHKVFAISEMLTRWTTRVRILFQYDRLMLGKIFETEHKSYFEKYIPYTIDLTPISFGRCLKVLLKSGQAKGHFGKIKQDDFNIVTSDAHIGQWFTLAGIDGIGCVVTLEPKWYSIRSVELFIKEVDAMIAESPEYDKKVVVLFQFVKHFLPPELFNINLSEGLAQNSIFTLEGAPCNIQKILEKLKGYNSGADRSKAFHDIFPDGSENMYYLLLMNKLGYRLPNIVASTKPTDPREIVSLSLTEDPSEIRDRDFNEKLDRMVRRMYAMGRSDRTNLENAVLELEDVLNLSGEQREAAFSEFLNKSYYEDFERVDNRTIFMIGMPGFIPIFQGFMIYENTSEYWLKLLDFYFSSKRIREITAELIQCLNYCRIDDRAVFIDILRRFNALKIIGNLNNTKTYEHFLRRYVTEILSLAGIHAGIWEYLLANEMSQGKIIDKFADIMVEVKSKLNKLRNSDAIGVIKDDCALMCSFLDKNNQLIQSKQKLKEHQNNISVHTEFHDPVQLIEEQIIKGKLTGSELDDFLADSYRNGVLKATEAQWLRKKFRGEVHKEVDGE